MTKPIKIPLPSRKKKVGLMYHVEVPETPHPLSVQCPSCMAQRAQNCYDERFKPKDFMEKQPRLKGGYHKGRVRWARQLHAIKILEQHGPLTAGGFAEHMWPGCLPVRMGRAAAAFLAALIKRGNVTKRCERYGTFYEVKRP